MSHSLQPLGYRVEGLAGEKKFFACPECPEHFWGTLCLLFSRYWGLFSGGKVIGMKLTTHLRLIKLSRDKS
jgi:hypothetical protein